MEKIFNVEVKVDGKNVNVVIMKNEATAASEEAVVVKNALDEFRRAIAFELVNDETLFNHRQLLAEDICQKINQVMSFLLCVEPDSALDDSVLEALRNLNEIKAELNDF